MVAFTENNERKVGEPAKRQAIPILRKPSFLLNALWVKLMQQGYKGNEPCIVQCQITWDNNTPRVKIDDIRPVWRERGAAHRPERDAGPPAPGGRNWPLLHRPDAGNRQARAPHEGVYSAAWPELGLGLTLKVDKATCVAHRWRCSARAYATGCGIRRAVAAGRAGQPGGAGHWHARRGAAISREPAFSRYVWRRAVCDT